MALSGSLTSYGGHEGRNYKVDWYATQSIVNNQSTITWTLSAVGGPADWYAERTLNVTIAGQTVFSKTARVERWKGNIATGSLTVSHDSVGNASFTITIQAAVYASAINSTGSQSFALDAIARKSTLSVGNGTLGSAQTLTVARQATSLTHTITATCGTASTTICTQSANTSISFTPPLAWASQNTSGGSVTVTYTITTYSGSTNIGSNGYSVICSIPASVKPSCSISVSDATGNASKFGGYIQNVSKLSISVTATSSYGSPITSYQTNADGSIYSGASVTTKVISSSGSLTITATVTDARGRSGSASTTIDVLAYTAPVITNISVHRCDSNGAENDRGVYAKVTYSYTINSLSNKNGMSAFLEYKKTSSSKYTAVTLDNVYTATNKTYIFAADDGSSYDVRLKIADSFNSTSVNTSVSTGFTIMHFSNTGKGICFGGISETDGLGVKMDAHFHNGITEDISVVWSGSCNNIVTSGNYYIGGDVTNRPSTYNGWLTVKAYDDGAYCYQQYVSYIGERYYRMREANTWREWISDGGVDFVTSQGVSGIVTYRKWRSGIAECWFTFDYSVSTSANGHVYIPKTVNFPFAFVSVPTVTFVSNNQSAWNHSVDSASITTGGIQNFVVYCTGAATVGGILSCYVVGAWK